MSPIVDSGEELCENAESLRKRNLGAGGDERLDQGPGRQPAWGTGAAPPHLQSLPGQLQDSAFGEQRSPPGFGQSAMRLHGEP